MWDFSQPYRTELWYKEVKDKLLRMPLCVPSYNRPNAPIFTSNLYKSLGKDNLFIFIRDTKEQYDLYKGLESNCTLVPLPKDVKEIGLTRESILQWGISNKYENLVMVDDRAKNLVTLVPGLTKNNKLCLKPVSWSTPLITLKIWEYIHKLYNTTISYAVFQPVSWYPNRINSKFILGGFTEAICINLNDCKKYDLHYKNVWEYGVEDTRFLWLCLKQGLSALQFTDLAYKEIPPEYMNQTTGSGATSKDFIQKSMTRKDRIEYLLKLFVEKSLGGVWKQPIEGFKYHTLKDGQIQVTFNWKEWTKYYEEHKIR